MGDNRVLMRGRLTPFLLAVVLGACSTNPGRTTAIGAGTGAALGAGLGAIVGAGTGNSGTGITLGTVAGTAAGTFVGNSIEGQDNEIASQGEVIRAQDRALMSQRAELDRLRARLGDDGSYSNSNTGPFPPAEHAWGQNAPSESGAPEHSMSFKGHGHDSYISGHESAGSDGMRSRAEFGTAGSGDFNESSVAGGSSDGQVFISKNKNRTPYHSGFEDRSASEGRGASTGVGSSSVEFSHGGGDSKLSASHPANRFPKYRDVQEEKGSTVINRSRVENKGIISPSTTVPEGNVVSKGTASRLEPERRVDPLSFSSAHPKRGRGALEEKPLPVSTFDNAQGEDKKVLSASSPSHHKVSETTASDMGSAKSGSGFEKVEKSDDSRPQGALTVSNGKECQDATKELARAGERALPADKLFHLRRALRLCPEDPRYHLELAALYRSLGRDGDAIYEYNEAVRVDPDNQEASKALKELGSSAG